MFRWVPYAMVRIAAFFIVGILAGIYQPGLLQLRSSIILSLLLVVAYLIFYLVLPIKKRKLPLGFIGLFAVLAIGYTHMLFFKAWNNPDQSITNDIKYYTAEVIRLPEEKENSWKYTIKILKISDGQEWEPGTAKALLYIKKEGNQASFFYGDQILIKGHPELLKEPQNPHEFDFKRFLSFKNIYHQQFATSDEVKLVSPILNKDFRYYSYLVREWAATQLKEQLTNPKEQAIALALALGVTDGIDNELQSAYAASGAMHVLAVSGLHVGILYGIILLLLRPLKNLSWSRWIVALVSLFVLWSFAFITGLSPSVLRAVTMFSFIALAKPFGKSTSIYNTLAASAFLLLLFDPYLIMSVGFQLSYLAVIGIVTIHRSLYQWWEPRSAVVDWIWNISCVSIAAQLATFSLGVLYFHQFPVYFLFSNLFVIPGATSILVLSIFVVVLSFISPVASLLGYVLQWLIQILNYGVFTFERLPFSLINDIYISTFQCWLLILALTFLLIMLHSKQLTYMIITLGFVMMFSLVRWQHYLTVVKQDQFVVYNVPGHAAFEWISNGQSQFFADSALIVNTERMRFHVRPNRLFRGVGDVTTFAVDRLQDGVRVVSRNGKKFGFVNKHVQSWPANLKLDYLIVGNNAFKSLVEIRNTIKFEKLILASNNSHFITSGILKESDESVYSVLNNGAYVENF